MTLGHTNPMVKAYFHLRSQETTPIILDILSQSLKTNMTTDLKYQFPESSEIQHRKFPFFSVWNKTQLTRETNLLADLSLDYQLKGLSKHVTLTLSISADGLIQSPVLKRTLVRSGKCHFLPSNRHSSEHDSSLQKKSIGFWMKSNLRKSS